MADAVFEDEALPLAVGDDPERNRAEEKIAAKRSFIRLPR
jgi:hypothetical protein